MSFCIPSLFAKNFETEKQKIKTNADRIRAMSDEELAEFLQDAKFYCQRNCEKCLRGTACISMLQWLKQPAEETNAHT